MSVQLIFKEIRSADNSKADINVSIELYGHTETDVVTSWARLGLGYVAQILADASMYFDPLLPAMDATITFDDSNEHGLDGIPMSFVLNTGRAHEYIGGLATPAITLAQEVFTCLNDRYIQTAEPQVEATE